MRTALFWFCGVAVLLTACGKRIDRSETVAIVPKPQSQQLLEGSFDLTRSTPVCIAGNDSMLLRATDLLNAVVSRSLGKTLRIEQEAAPRPGAINIALDDSLGPEAYVLKITPEQIDVTGGSPAGVFYAFQSLRQLLPEAALNGERAAVIELPAVEVADSPHFAYRGTMLDASRHFFSVDEVKQYIDLLAMHKINRFHWHLTDDQGWRLEIKKYPDLTRIGSVRAKDLVNHSLDSVHKFDERPYGGFYTQEQAREVVRYAADRFITVIPEIEMPGHATAALAAYPDLGCVGKGYEVSTIYGIHNDAFCAGKESTFAFLEDVLAEVMEIFPSEYIHIGGDECRKERWEACPRCQQRIRDQKLKDEVQLQSYFVGRIEKYLNAHGRKLIGWDEILEGGLSQTATVMSWRGTTGGIAAAKRGNEVIMTPYAFCYFDYYQTRDTVGEPLAYRKILPVDSVYTFDPYAGLTSEEQKYILGVQANLWTEYIRNADYLQYMTLPRLAALAEVGWTYGPKDYADFKNRMNALVKVYDAQGYNYGKHIFVKSQQ